MSKGLIFLLTILLLFQMGGLDTIRNQKKVSYKPCIPILIYHEFGNSENPYFVDEEVFIEEMEYLKERGFKTFTLKEVSIYVETKTLFPERAIVLSFDDGYSSAYSFVYPILKNKEMVGSFSIVTNYIQQEGYLTEEEIGEMYAKGMEIVNHSATHRRFSEISSYELKEELGRSFGVLKSMGIYTKIVITPHGENIEIEDYVVRGFNAYNSMNCLGQDGVLKGYPLFRGHSFEEFLRAIGEGKRKLMKSHPSIPH
ncbi:MAG: polysaccharide deacetylase family protein [Candidatus Methanofastidiosia archaeon]